MYFLNLRVKELKKLDRRRVSLNYYRCGQLYCSADSPADPSCPCAFLCILLQLLPELLPYTPNPYIPIIIIIAPTYPSNNGWSLPNTRHKEWMCTWHPKQHSALTVLAFHYGSDLQTFYVWYATVGPWWTSVVVLPASSLGSTVLQRLQSHPLPPPPSHMLEVCIYLYLYIPFSRVCTILMFACWGYYSVSYSHRCNQMHSPCTTTNVSLMSLVMTFLLFWPLCGVWKT